MKEATVKIKEAKKRRFEGTVTSLAMAKTVVVLVTRTTWHQKYGKQFSTSKKFKAHDLTGNYKIGDKVIIEECRPISKDKKWRVIGKVSPTGRSAFGGKSHPSRRSEAEAEKKEEIV